jgi:beta-aspartyl-peptidase (threonine type)
MRRLSVLVIAAAASVAWAGNPAPEAVPNVVLAIHGGAGPAPRERFKADPKLATQYADTMKQALEAGQRALQEHGNSVDGVEAAIRVMEDSPLFNAGKGAVFTHEGRNELDSSIMDGNGRRAGAVAGVTRLKNPISAARAVMDRSEHVMFVADGADRFGAHHGVEEVSPVYFWTERQWKGLQTAIARQEQKKAGNKAALAPVEREKFGTVGCVVLWKGNLAAGTSTGGMTNKMPGRAGDTPVIGAGTYAENGACAVSCTGHGEMFIRHAVAHDITARVKYLKQPVDKAAADVLRELPQEKAGVGGLIALDSKGNLATPFDTPAMFRGYLTSDGKIHLAIFEEELVAK